MLYPSTPSFAGLLSRIDCLPVVGFLSGALVGIPCVFCAGVILRTMTIYSFECYFTHRIWIKLMHLCEINQAVSSWNVVLQ